MATTVHPEFTLTLGGLASSSARAVGGPQRLVVNRGMGGCADALTVDLAERRGVAAGDDATLALGFDGQTDTVFTGRVAEVRPHLAGVRVLALGTLAQLLRLRLGRAYADRSAGAIVRDLAGSAGVAVGQADDGPTLPRFAVDPRRTAAAHLRALADRLGFELYTDRQGQLQFRALGAAAGLDSATGGLGGGLGGLAAGAAAAASSAAMSAASALLGLGGGGGALGYVVGQHLMAAQAAQRTPGIGQVQVGGEGPASSQGDQSSWWLSVGEDANHGQAGDGGADATLLVLDAAARTRDLADRFAAGRLAQLQRDGHRLWLRTLGRATVELGDTVQVSGAGDGGLDASGYVQALTHRFSAHDGFTTELSLVIDSSGGNR